MIQFKIRECPVSLHMIFGWIEGKGRLILQPGEQWIGWWHLCAKKSSMREMDVSFWKKCLIYVVLQKNSAKVLKLGIFMLYSV